MKSKWIIAAVLIIALFSLCGLMAFLGWTTLAPVFRNGVVLGPLEIPTSKAEETKTETLSVQAQNQLTLDVQNYFGDIDVSAPPTGTVNAGQVQVTYHKTSWGINDTEA